MHGPDEAAAGDRLRHAALDLAPPRQAGPCGAAQLGPQRVADAGLEVLRDAERQAVHLRGIAHIDWFEAGERPPAKSSYQLIG